MPRYIATIEYNGSEYVGWQKQENGISIQESFENAIKKQTNHYLLRNQIFLRCFYNNQN